MIAHNIVVTVARKPLSEGTVAANVLAHGSGALNIDAARVGGAPSPSVERRKHAAPGLSVGATGWTTPVAPTEYNQQRHGETLGRWPANLILQHLGECRQVGTKLVKASSGIRPKDVGVTYDSHKSRSMAGAMIPVLASSYSDEDGNEEIAAWECVSGCPVAALDEQSGQTRPGHFPRTGNTESMFGPNNHAGGPENNGFGDTGGASRYFKAFGGQQ